MSAWTKFATKFYQQEKKKNADYKFSQALKDAAKAYKKGGDVKVGGKIVDGVEVPDDEAPVAAPVDGQDAASMDNTVDSTDEVVAAPAQQVNTAVETNSSDEEVESPGDMEKLSEDVVNGMGGKKRKNSAKKGKNSAKKGKKSAKKGGKKGKKSAKKSRR